MRFLILSSCLICAHLLCAETSFSDSSSIIHPKESFDFLGKKQEYYKWKPRIQHRSLIEQRENKNRAILFYRTGGDSSVFYGYKIEDGTLVNIGTSFVSDYNRDNDVILESAKSIGQPWTVVEGYENHIQLISVEKRNYLVKDYKIFDADCPVFIRLQDGVCVFRSRAGPWSRDHLKAMWKESIKPMRHQAIQCQQ